MGHNVGENRMLPSFFILGMPFALVGDIEESSGILVRWNPNRSSGW